MEIVTDWNWSNESRNHNVKLHRTVVSLDLGDQLAFQG